MGVCLPRFLGAVEQLPAGQWTHDMVDGRTAAAIRCPQCGGIEHVDRRSHHVDSGGVVVPRIECSTTTCSWLAWVTLESWEP